MLKIIYTITSNIDEESSMPIDSTLLITSEVNTEDDIPGIIGTDYTLISTWDSLEYDSILANNKIALKEQLKESIEYRPRIPLTLESGITIEIDGGRDDKDNFKEESDRMLRNGIIETHIKDADNIPHIGTQVDIYNGYVAIVNNFSIVMLDKWAKEEEIDNITTI